MTTPLPQPLAAIGSFHAHVYFDGPAQREIALALRDRIAERFRVTLGRVHDRLIGPHARAMYQVAFEVEVFGKFVPWLMLNRQGLTVLVHPNTRDERGDHLSRALWMGEILDIVGPERLAADMEPERAPPPNTQPTLEP
jgi:aromatic ring-cleaving dioxygenase